MDRVGTSFFAALLAAAGILAAALLGAASARAESCPGNPDALGTSRDIVVSPNEYKELGTLDYKQTLPLADHEVVLTFDDGPLPPWSDKALDILNAECVKATFFIIGEMAQNYPQVVRREYESGDTIGTHSMTHPQPFQRQSGDKLDYQIDAGIAAVSAALGDPDEVAPFFRIPGFGRSDAIEDALAKRGLVVFCVDVVADDWVHHITAAQIVQRAISRLEKRGSGILLLHDIHPWTIAALPELLKQLKQKGFHVVHMVPPPPTGPLIAGGPRAWALAAAMPQARLVDAGGVSPAWPLPYVQSDASFAESDILPAPNEADFAVDQSLRIDVAAAGGSDGAGLWPKLADIAPPSTDTDLPAPGLGDIGVSLRGEQLAEEQIHERPQLDVPIAIGHGIGRGMGRGRWLAHRRGSGHDNVRRVRLREHRPEQHAASSGHRA
jgi:peptidoglycan-N-acetylglucosamine deacetylase